MLVTAGARTETRALIMPSAKARRTDHTQVAAYLVSTAKSSCPRGRGVA